MLNCSECWTIKNNTNNECSKNENIEMDEWQYTKR